MDLDKQWYVVNTYSGHENKVKEKLEMRASTMGMEDYIYRVVVPEQKEVEVKDGKEKTKVKKMFPGYILVEMVMTDEAWFIVRNTPGVTGFIGSSGKGAKPFPLTPAEVDKILGSMGLSRLEIGNSLNVGDKVKVVGGPFGGMIGVVKSLDMENQKVEVTLDLFGQETVVELGLTEIEEA
jgi:transcriptional antiterminator NusG